MTNLYDRMARIEITPTWATVFDFESCAPKAIIELAAKKRPTKPDAGSPDSAAVGSVS